MTGEIFEGYLWFNASKEEMRRKLIKTSKNSCVGINIGKNSEFFNPNVKFVKLIFDDGTKGRALIKKDSWNNCTHLIQKCIGNWARNNGLWKKKLSKRTVKVKIKVLKNNKRYLISKK